MNIISTILRGHKTCLNTLTSDRGDTLKVGGRGQVLFLVTQSGGGRGADPPAPPPPRAMPAKSNSWS